MQERRYIIYYRVFQTSEAKLEAHVEYETRVFPYRVCLALHALRPLQTCLQRSEQVGLKTKQAAFHTFYSKPMTTVYTV